MEASAAATFLILLICSFLLLHLSTCSHPSHSALSASSQPHPTPGMASILMSAVGLGVHFTSAPLPQQQPQHQQHQQPAPFSLPPPPPPPLLPPASRPSKPHSSSSSSSVRRAKRQHRRGSYHASSPQSISSSPSPSIGVDVISTGLRDISSCIAFFPFLLIHVISSSSTLGGEEPEIIRRKPQMQKQDYV